MRDVFKMLTGLLFASIPASAMAEQPALNSVATWSPPDATVQVQPANMQVNAEALHKYGEGAELVHPESDASLNRELNLIGEKFAFTASAPANTKFKGSQKSNAAALKVGAMITKDHGIGGVDDYFPITLTKSESGYTVSGIFGIGGKMEVSINEETGEVSIAPQLLYTHNSYGEIWFCYLDADKRVYSTETPVKGQVNADGSISIGGWGAFIISGTYAGNAFGAYRSADWVPSNATLKLTDFNDQIETLTGLVEQNTDNKVTIYNFAGNGTPVTGLLSTTGSLRISPQYISSNQTYGDLYCYQVDSTTGKINTSGSITGLATADNISINSWCVAARAYPSATFLTVKSLELTMTEGSTITLPTPVAVSFNGDGTTESPYTISNAAELGMLSQSVASGEAYTGKTFKVTADIDMSSASASYIPIGNESASFNGTFDGANHSISNLTINGLGENNIGLFGYTGTDALLNNIKLVNASISGSGSNLGCLVGTNKGTISSCSVEGSVASDGIISGGIAGLNHGTIESCSFTGAVTNLGNAGGIVGDSYGFIKDCSAEVEITINGLLNTMYNDAGGIAGACGPLGSNGGKISGCVVSGFIVDNYGRANMGGIVGTTVRANVEQCLNTATLQGKRVNPEYDTATGGIVGLTTESTFRDCANAGNIVKTDNSESVGGLAGYLLIVYSNVVEQQSHFFNCYNSAPVSSTSSATHKGLWGNTFYLREDLNPLDGVFTNCYFDSQLSGLDDAELGRNTEFFANGTLPEGFSSDVWNSAAGLYPVHKVFANTNAGKLAATHPALNNGETVKKVRSNFSLNGSDITYQLFVSGSGFTNATSGLKINGTNVELAGDYNNDLLVAFDPSKKYYRMWQIAAAPKLFSGNGTETEPFLIKTVDDAKTLHRAISSFGQTHEGDFFKMTNDIDFANSGFEGIGARSFAGFSGTFDGGNHSVNNLVVKSAARDDSGNIVVAGSYYYGGFFSVINPTGTVKNIVIEDNNTLELFGKGAAVAGYNAGRVENCYNYAEVKAAYQSAAGIVGYVAEGGVVEGCYNAGNIYAADKISAGIVAENYGDIILCQNDGNIAACAIEGMNYSTTKTPTTAAGIAGENYGNLDRCVNNGTITAANTVGGLVAQNSTSKSKGGIKASINNAIVNCTAESEFRGGVIGRLLSADKMTSVYYDGSLNTFGAAHNAGLSGVTGLCGADLTSGMLPEGLDAADWDVSGHKYPVLARFASEPATAYLRAMVVAFNGNNNRNSVVSETELFAPRGAQWSLNPVAEPAEGEEAPAPNFYIENGKLHINTPTGMTLANDVLTCSFGDVYSKVIPVRALPVIFEGMGTTESPYLIPDTESWNKLAEFVLTTKTDFSGSNFKITSDLDFTAEGVTLTPLASGTLMFQGAIDGGNHTIKYAYNNTTTAAGLGKNCGLISNLGGSGKLSNLTTEGSFTCNSYGGAFVGKLYGHLENCVNKATVIGSSAGYMGGLVYKAFNGAVINNCRNEGTVASKNTYTAGIVIETEEGTIVSNCVNTGAVTSGDTKNTTAAKAANYVAGIAVIANGTVTGCRNEGVLTGDSYISGIVQQTKKAAIIEDCHNTVDIIGNANIAGIVETTTAKMHGAIRNCSNTGNITGVKNLAGVVRSLGSGFTLENCYNTGNITTDKFNTTAAAGSVGGVVQTASGANDYPILISNCYNTGNITSANTGTGGFAGSISGDTNAIVEDCYNTGNVTMAAAKEPTGTSGVAGFAGSLSAYVTHCYNTGDVTANAFGVGGFAGYGSAVITECFNLGNVTSTFSGTPGANFCMASGIIAQGKNNVIRCYNAGDITAPDRAAGLNGAMWAGAILEDSFNIGKVSVTNEDASDVDAISIYRNNSAGTASSVGCFYDSNVNAHLPKSEHGEALSTTEMYDAEVAEGFITAPYSYPRLEAFADHSHANWVAASLGLGANDTHQNITQKIYLAQLPGVVWTSSEHFEIEDGVAESVKLGEGTITASTEDGKHVKNYNFIVTGYSGIENVIDGEVVETTYYDLQGRQIANPTPGVYVMRQRMADGSKRSATVMVR